MYRPKLKRESWKLVRRREKGWYGSDRTHNVVTAFARNMFLFRLIRGSEKSEKSFLRAIGALKILRSLIKVPS
jgi:hypothetical protein